MSKKIIKDYLVMSKNNDLALAVDYDLLSDVEINDMYMIINQSCINESSLILSDLTKNNILKFLGIDTSDLKLLNDIGFVYLMIVKDDILYKTFRIEKFK